MEHHPSKESYLTSKKISKGFEGRRHWVWNLQNKFERFLTDEKPKRSEITIFGKRS